MLSTSPTKPRSVGSRVERPAPRADEAAVLAVESDRAAAVLVDQSCQLLVEFAEGHFDDGERALVGHARTAMATAFDAHLLHQFVDAPAAAMDHDGFHSDQPQQRHVARETRLERRVGHRLAAEAHDQRLAVIRADVRQRFGEDPAFVDACHRGGQTCMLSVFDAVCVDSTSTSTSTA